MRDLILRMPKKHVEIHTFWKTDPISKSRKFFTCLAPDQPMVYHLTLFVIRIMTPAGDLNDPKNLFFWSSDGQVIMGVWHAINMK